MDYDSEVNSHVAKLLLLWEPLMLKSLISACKIRAHSARPCCLLPAAQRSSCAVICWGGWQHPPTARGFLDKQGLSH